MSRTISSNPAADAAPSNNYFIILFSRIGVRKRRSAILGLDTEYDFW